MESIDPKFEWIRKDDRSLTEILDKATDHYAKYQKTDDAGERFAYLVEMYTLRDHLLLLSFSLYNEDMPRAIVAKNTFKSLGNRDPYDYSVKELAFLGYITDQLENPETELNPEGCDLIFIAIGQTQINDK